MKACPAVLDPGRVACSAAYDLMWVYHLATLGLAAASGAAEIAAKTVTSACDGV